MHHKIFPEDLNLHCDLELEDRNPQITPRLMMMHHYTKFGCKRFRSSGDMELSIFEDLTLHYDLDLDGRNQTFSHDTLVMMMHHHAKLGWIQFSGSEDIRTKVRQSDNPIPTYPPNLVTGVITTATVPQPT